MGACHWATGEILDSRTMRRNYVFINAEGYMDIMPIAEAEAIERSGACSLWEYISTPTTWPQQTVPFVTLMEARPGATEPVELHGAWIDRNGMPWTYDELCQLLKDNPRTLTEQLQWGKERGRRVQGVHAQLYRLSDLMNQRKIKWDGERILRGRKAQVDQWPVGFRNPK